MCYLYSHTSNHTHILSLSQECRKSCSQWTPWWWLQPVSLSRWGERGALAWQWVVKAQLASAVDRPLLLERTSPRTLGWCSEHSLSLCLAFLCVLRESSPHIPTCKWGWHNSLSSLPASVLCLPQWPISCHGAVQHWWGHCWNGENYTLLQPLRFNLTGSLLAGVRITKILFPSLQQADVEQVQLSFRFDTHCKPGGFGRLSLIPHGIFYQESHNSTVWLYLY